MAKGALTQFYKQNLELAGKKLSVSTLRTPFGERGDHSTAGRDDAFFAMVGEEEAYGFCCYSGGSATVHRLHPQQIKVAQWLCETAGRGTVYLRGQGTEYTGEVMTARASWCSSCNHTNGGRFWTVDLWVDCMLQSAHITLPVMWAIFGNEVLRVDHYEAGSNIGYTTHPEGPYLSMRLEFDVGDVMPGKTALALDDFLAV